MTDRDYQHSRPLDVHRWSDHREINNLVDLVFIEVPICITYSVLITIRIYRFIPLPEDFYSL